MRLIPPVSFGRVPVPIRRLPVPIRRLPLTRAPIARVLAPACVLVSLAGCSATPAAPALAPAVATRTSVAAVAPANDVCGGIATSAVAAAHAAAYSGATGSTLTARAKAAGSSAVALRAGTTTLRDFVAGPERIDAARVPAASLGIVGQGVRRSTMTIAPHSSTRRSKVPKVEYQVNPLNELRVSSAHPVVGDFTLRGTQQGHTYNGLRIERSTNARVAHVRVIAVPGNMDRPPGETFGINDYRTNGSRYEHVEVDGAGVGAAGFAANGSKNITVCATTSHDNKVSMGFAFWSVRNITLVDCIAVHNGFSGFNFERVSGRVTLVHPVAQHNRWDMRVVSDLGSAQYRIVDPDLSKTQVKGKWTVALPSTYWKHPSRQKRSDIALIVHGKSRPDLLRLVRPY